jgi:hypothetical protein
VISRGAVRRAAWLVAALASVAVRVRAQESSELGVSERDCVRGVTAPSAALLELVRLELRADGVARVTRANASQQSGRLLWIERGCPRVGEPSAAVDGSALVIGYRDRARDRSLERSLSLADVPPALRERALALALAELFRAGEANPGDEQSFAASNGEQNTRGDSVSHEDTTAADQRVARAVEELPDSTDREQTTDTSDPAGADAASAANGGETTSERAASDHFGSRLESAWTLAVGPTLHALPANSALLFGAEVALSWRRLNAGVLGSLGGDSDRLGSIDYRRLHGFVAYEALSTELAPFRITAGLRAALGATFASVTPIAAAVPRDVTASSGDVALETGVRWILSPRWQTKLGLDIGYAFGPRLQADDRELANFSGFFIGASLCAVAALGSEVY